MTINSLVNGSGWLCTPTSAVGPATISCTKAAGVAIGATNETVVTLNATKTGSGSVTNLATVTSGDPACTATTPPARCSATATVDESLPAFTITKTVGSSPLVVGVPNSYTLAVQNTGNAATTAVSTITDTIPAGLTIGTLPAGCSSAGQTVTCTVAAGLAVNGSASFVIPVTATLSAGNPVVNTATVSGGGDPGCPAAARCSSTTTTPLNAPQLTVTKTASAASFVVGVPASYTLQLSNTGTAATTAVTTITDTIPTGLTIGTLPAGCTAAGQTVTCTVATGLAPVIASEFDEVIKLGQTVLISKKFFAFGSHDLKAAEIAGAFKNIIALASGILAGMGMGKNMQSLLITRGLREMTYFGTAMGTSGAAYLGMAGIGDLIATATSEDSRNDTFGQRLAQGEDFNHIMATSTEVVEGVRTLQIINQLAKHEKLVLPIVQVLHKVIFEGFDMQRALVFLMNDSFAVDVDFL